MTRDDIIRMAREAGVYTAHTELTLMAGLERFAALVAAAEREACAKVCEAAAKQFGLEVPCAVAIRARSQS